MYLPIGAWNAPLFRERQVSMAMDVVGRLNPGVSLDRARDEMTAVASQYYAKLPRPLDKSFVLMIDPMLATGGSAVAALDLLCAAGARDIPRGRTLRWCVACCWLCGFPF